MSTDIIERKDIFSRVEKVLYDLYATGDIEGAILATHSLEKVENVVGLAKAKLYTGMKDWYSKTEGSARGFWDVVGITSVDERYYNERLIVLWNELPNIPDTLHSLPIQSLIACSQALEDDYEITEKDWIIIEDLRRSSEVQKYVTNKIRKIKPRKGTLVMVEQDGEVGVWFDGKFVDWVARLNIKSTNPVVEKAIKRLLSCGVDRK